jgi:hypothetical protein
VRPMPTQSWTVRVALDSLRFYERQVVLDALRYLDPVVQPKGMDAIELHVRAPSRDGAVDYVHKAMGRLMLGGPESVKVIDLRAEPDRNEARSP